MIFNNVIVPLIAGTAGFISAFIWSGPIFVIFSKIIHLPQPPQKPKNLLIKISLNYFVFIITSFSMSILLHSLAISSFQNGIPLILLMWLGFIVTSSSIDVIWKDKSLKLCVFECASAFCAILITGLVLLLFYV